MALKNIAIFGKRNAGKSSLINTLLGQEYAIVSDIAGTTTDPVKKRVEILGIGPVVLIDTAGLDDSGELGGKRVEKSLDMIDQIDLALLVYTANDFGAVEGHIFDLLREAEVPVVLVHNQSDIVSMDRDKAGELSREYGLTPIEFSNNSFDEQEQEKMVSDLVSKMTEAIESSPLSERKIFEELVERGDNVLLVCPIDSEAPEGRLILPQVMAIRDLLDRDARAIVLLPESLESYLADNISQIKLVVTDSQVFPQVSTIVPESLALTSFSILLARSKGFFNEYLRGTPRISELKDGDKLLMLESCTHHTSCEDIGRYKIPALFRKFTGKELSFDFVTGLDRVETNIDEYAMVVQCGGCMVTARQLRNRLKSAIKVGIPITNYGMAISYMSGIFARATALFKNEENE